MINRNLNPFVNDEFDLTSRINFSNRNSKSSCSVGSIVAINTSPVSVNIQPAIKYFDETAGFQEPQILQNIPVAQIASSSASVRFPLNVGDVGVILWFDREVYSWLENASVGPIAPDSGNLHNEAACIFIPLVQKFSQAPAVKNTGVDFVSEGQSLMTQLIEENNKLLTHYSNLLTYLTAWAAINPSDPPTSLANLKIAASVLQTNVTTSVTNLTTINTKLTTFKGDQ